MAPGAESIHQKKHSGEEGRWPDMDNNAWGSRRERHTHSGIPWGRYLSLAALAAGLFLITCALTVWLTAGPPERKEGQVILLLDEGLAGKADLLAQAVADPEVKLEVEGSNAAAVTVALAGGSADLALLSGAGTAGEVIGQRFPILAVPFLHPLEDISQAEAQRVLQALSEPPATVTLQGDLPAACSLQLLLPQTGQTHLSAPADLEADLLLVGERQDLGPGWRPLRVNGVLPDESNLKAGRYPLVEPIRLLTRRNGDGFLSSLLDQHRFPNREATAAVTAWLRGEEGQAFLAGDEPAVTLTAVGDIMLARAVERRIQEFGADYPFRRVTPYLQRSDLTFANLESPLGIGGTPIPNKGIWFRADPALAATMASAGIDVVTLANNHILDYDSDVFLQTLQALTDNGLQYCGGGRDETEAHRPLIVSKNGVRLAFLGYSQFADLFWDWDYERTFAAGPDLPGIAGLSEERLAQVTADIAQARQQADVVIVACHWGDEYVEYPNEQQRRLAHALAEAGADLILGSHPHAIQGFENYQGTLIVYSLGNFIMDQARPETCRSMILDVQITAAGISGVWVTPAAIAEAQPYVPAGAEYQELAERIRRISRPLVEG